MKDSTRIADIFIAAAGLLFLLPVFITISILIKLASRGSVFFVQERVGKNGIDFKMYKFRSMSLNSHTESSLTIGHRDTRVTTIGYYLRKLKLDELPQIFNVLKGDMSMVGPRPELKKYVNLYNSEQRKVLSIKPGITDYASVKYRNENDLLANAKDSEQLYIKEIMPHKLELNMYYINNKNLKTYFSILFYTFWQTERKKIKLEDLAVKQ
ncbi:MAG: sugar transferase [Parafilimonas sp.]